ncbi:MAG TPA: cell division protein SepF [Candidatus Methanofastidiosa archaeon]|nr:cell division protein SepF [Candidatus Methanofastidiosa archaeon]HPR41859.1 cell division protein SepF [Candidatus Methanofastidiosa archaeon]
MRKLSNIFGDAGDDDDRENVKESRMEEPVSKYRSVEDEPLDMEEDSFNTGLKDVSHIKYEEDILGNERFFDYGVTYVKTLKLRSLADVQKVSHELNEGNIVIANIALLNERDPMELKRTIDQVKGICRGIGGDVAGIGDTMHVIITPANIKIWRSKV